MQRFNFIVNAVGIMTSCKKSHPRDDPQVFTRINETNVL